MKNENHTTVNIPIHQYFVDGKPCFKYIRTGEFKHESEKEAFILWMRGQTRPLIDNLEGDQDACYLWDYLRFQDFMRGKPVVWD